MNELPAGLYAIADASFGDPAGLAIQLAQSGCKIIQLRAKHWHESDVLQVAKDIQPTLSELGVALIINDHPRVAERVGARGVHLGQTDLRPETAREIVGPSALVGWSTHSLSQVQVSHGADYIGFGPVFTTSTKANALPQRGLKQLREAVVGSTVPVVAIGGIDGTNILDVQTTGVHGWAVVSALYRSGDIPTAVAALNSSIPLK